ncbi:UDP-3-O-acyl-N-acetylglucosamine deacetylase [Campylobacter insulaenigrae]|uniref:UDP-3-O-acyl-N-acetylglucosamine deacetylase n=1 Tax=Campylobacter insulaenigrae NCTC 12927 TaxID=1031564 RepID=A0A0A8GZX2_9BACT|nr:UDP-3-O-acyl-N-acetylglucosamine deacetylase [Campylobacter insulaenigrae]AJC87212.1 UDP-3-O-acyl-N-acetylglucosamine deacetylase [Campylobacter insulaenigrae NCTC 12927]MCR6591900.1 UDP-3-O-acyl-N-acetylglucosamine deacetylase [Campylobacter insulaenigrae]MCR6593387.1 UDP-3-O-acyl-N-acetylglucosamine deacetylase [Campylobacter insulaenigrae]VEH93047.1 UDP-3-O-[3-hydroxymyristoyl] N-acetylglucosamine deacetylase [Campylobacter insulaenigrae]VEJ52563.1 UDP-3-O-[3-hydroxymyristoyl] N-acetylgl
MNQTTIAKVVKGVGIGLHKGEPISIQLEPLDANSGIVFYRSDLGISYEAKPENVIDTKMATVIGDHRGYVSTIEHLMSAINAYGIDNVRIVLDANEAPVMDGSSIGFCMMLDEAGLKELDEVKKILVVKKTIEVQEGNKFVRLTPTDMPVINYTIEFDNPIIGKQNYYFEFSKQNYIEQIARARTFGFLKDVQALRALNLGLGGSLENAVVIDDNRILNPEGLRFKDEFVRHKILDAIGDLTLLGYRVFGDYVSYAGSHRLNHLLTKELLKDASAYEIVNLEKSSYKIYEKVFA